MKDDIVLLDIQ